jgi:hypothetical protein
MRSVIASITVRVIEYTVSHQRVTHSTGGEPRPRRGSPIIAEFWYSRTFMKRQLRRRNP